MRAVFLFLLTLFPFAVRAEEKVKTAHVIVALCDNFYQGIVPVPLKLGDGDDPSNNLYWGAMYGVKTYFKKQPDLDLVLEIKNPAEGILERAVFLKKDKSLLIVADAYRGREIKKAVSDYFEYLAGFSPQRVQVPGLAVTAGGGADLIAYVGHDGLMDFSLPFYPSGKAGKSAVALACYSQSYFADGLKSAGADPVLVTTHKLAPEAYVLKAALDAYARGAEKSEIREKAAESYAKYQKLSVKAALRLFAVSLPPSSE